MLSDGVRVPIGHPPVVIATPGNTELAQEVVGHLSWELGKVTYRTFPNGEISVHIEQPVANCDVFVICSRDDAQGEINFTLIQLLVLLDALKSEAPYRITVVLPCLEYGRQDRKFEAGEAIAPKLLLNLMASAGANRFVTIDLHNQAESGFSPIGCNLDELSAEQYMADFIRQNIPNFTPEETLVCATDAGGAKRTRRMADELRVGFMMADKFRPKAGEVGQVKIISDASLDPKDVIIIDDMFDTCGSLVKVVQAVNSFAPNATLYAVATHGYFSGRAHESIKRMAAKNNLEWIAVTNTIGQTTPTQKFTAAGIEHRLQVVDLSRLIAGAVIRIHLGVSVNLPKFRNIGPSKEDPLLKEARLIPTSQYTLSLGGGAEDDAQRSSGQPPQKMRRLMTETSKESDIMH